MASAKKEETDLFDILKDLAKNWRIMIPCIIVAGIVGVFVAMWIRPIYKVDALLQIETGTKCSLWFICGCYSKQYKKSKKTNTATSKFGFEARGRFHNE